MGSCWSELKENRTERILLSDPEGAVARQFQPFHEGAGEGSPEADRPVGQARRDRWKAAFEGQAC
jgi:hypothetical protein